MCLVSLVFFLSLRRYTKTFNPHIYPPGVRCNLNLPRDQTRYTFQTRESELRDGIMATFEWLLDQGIAEAESIPARAHEDGSFEVGDLHALGSADPVRKKKVRCRDEHTRAKQRTSLSTS